MVLLFLAIILCFQQESENLDLRWTKPDYDHHSEPIISYILCGSFEEGSNPDAVLGHICTSNSTRRKETTWIAVWTEAYCTAFVHVSIHMWSSTCKYLEHFSLS